MTNAQVADLYVVYATVDPSAGMRGVTAFLVERDTPGMSVSEPIEKMGLRTSPMGEVVFEDCLVPEANVLGEPGGGASVFNASMAWGSALRQPETATRTPRPASPSRRADPDQPGCMRGLRGLWSQIHLPLATPGCNPAGTQDAHPPELVQR